EKCSYGSKRSESKRSPVQERAWVQVHGPWEAGSGVSLVCSSLRAFCHVLTLGSACVLATCLRRHARTQRRAPPRLSGGARPCPGISGGVGGRARRGALSGPHP